VRLPEVRASDTLSGKETRGDCRMERKALAPKVAGEEVDARGFACGYGSGQR